jgi:hypothetical protein
MIALVVIVKLVDLAYPPSSVSDNGRIEKKLTTAYVVARRALKESLKDPDSYQEISHKEYYEAGSDSVKNNMQVLIHYRSKNSLGGYVVDKEAFTFDSTGTITDSYTTD